MNSESIDKLIEEKAEARRKSRRIKAVSVMAAVVAFCTTCSLISPAFTLERKPDCGEEEHVHTEECYKIISTASKCELACEIEEHEHTDACYETTQTLICELEENEEHEHTDACYATVVTLICDKEEHAHSEACYEVTEGTEEKVLVCEKKEHKHSDSCYKDSSNNTNSNSGDNRYTLIEDSGNWEVMFDDVQLSGSWGDDIVAIAGTQIGYRECTGGYTRYGGWYGIPDGAWCAMFASFCINYAEVEGFPYASECQSWINELKGMDLYHDADEDNYVPKPGDLVFFDWSGSTGGRTSDHVGIVAEYIPATEIAGAKIITIEGNYCDKVCKLSYPATSGKIMGYGEMLINPNLAVEVEGISLDVEYNEMNGSVLFSAELGEIDENAYEWQWERSAGEDEKWEVIDGAEGLVCSAALDEESADALYRIRGAKVDADEGDESPRYIASAADNAKPESSDFLFMSEVFDLGNEAASIAEEHPCEDAGLKAEISQITTEESEAAEAAEVTAEAETAEEAPAAPEEAEVQPAKQMKSGSIFKYMPNGVNASRHPMRSQMKDKGRLYRFIEIQADAIRVEPMVVFAVEMAILLVLFLAGFAAYKLYKKHYR